MIENSCKRCYAPTVDKAKIDVVSTDYLIASLRLEKLCIEEPILIGSFFLIQKGKYYDKS